VAKLKSDKTLSARRFTDMQQPPESPETTCQRRAFTSAAEGISGCLSLAGGARAKFSEREPPPQEDLIAEESIKRELHPLDAYAQIVENAIGTKRRTRRTSFASSGTVVFPDAGERRHSWHDSGIPGGVVTTHQLREPRAHRAATHQRYVQITTRANFQMRLIQPTDAPEFLRRVQSIGLHTRGAGAETSATSRQSHGGH